MWYCAGSVRLMVVMFMQQSLGSALHNLVCARYRRVTRSGSPSSLRGRGQDGASASLSPATPLVADLYHSLKR